MGTAQGTPLGCEVPTPASSGPYIVDFCSVAVRLVVEIDGPHHDLTKDQLRDRELSDRGYRTLRFTSLDVHRDLDRVVREIQKHLPEKRTG